MNEADRAPSPKRRLKRFGNIQASSNAPEAQFAPRTLIIRLSRIRPRMRDSRVIELTTEVDFRSRLPLTRFFGAPAGNSDSGD
jgi:hypothetical protein